MVDLGVASLDSRYKGWESPPLKMRQTGDEAACATHALPRLRRC